MMLNGGDCKPAISMGIRPAGELGTMLPPDRAFTVRTRPSIFTPRFTSASRSIETKASAGSGTATPPMNPVSPSGRLPEISSVFAPSPR